VGSQPATVPSGPDAGRRILGPEEDFARQLATSLDPDQLALGISAEIAPDDILTRADPVANPSVLPGGIGRDQLRPAQQELLDRCPVRSEASELHPMSGFAGRPVQGKVNSGARVGSAPGCCRFRLR